MNKIEISSIASEKEIQNRQKLLELMQKTPLPQNELVSNAALFLKRQELQKLLFFNDIYQKILDVHGVIVEFGTRWGQNLVTLSNLRGIYEPYNYNRKIIGFDTFEGFKNVSAFDGHDEKTKDGAFSVSNGYEEYLKELMAAHENESPLNHIKKHEIIKGDASLELKKYLEQNPQTMVAFAYFDFDIYKPTRDCLEMLLTHVTKGSIIGFDELNDPKFPGETIALNEILSLRNVAVKRSRFSGMQSYLIVE
ncbi:MAG: hypothetical protein JXB34_13580 [Bacteroidales bacterium]|nr:hypothetical protein [Bacteroidales bacterium]